MSTFQRPVKVMASTLPSTARGGNGDEEANVHNKVEYIAPASVALKATVLFLLLSQNTSYTLLRRYSMASLREKYDPQEVLLMGEVFKLVFSVAMTWSDPSPSDAGPGGQIVKRLIYLTLGSGKMMALAMIYGAMNVLSFVAIRRIDAAVFTVCAQLKILTTAAFSVVLLRRRLTPTKWRALVQLVLGCILVTVPQIAHKDVSAVAGEDSEESELSLGANAAQQDYASGTQFAFGVLAVLLEVTMSGFASIYFEKVIKTADEKVTVWDRNYQLALHSILLYTIYSFIERNYFTDHPPPYRPLHDFSHLAWILAFLGGGGGLLVAMTVKVADSIIKTLAVSIAIVTSTLASHFLLGGPLDLPMAIGALIVALAVLNYTLDATAGSGTAPSQSK